MKSLDLSDSSDDGIHECISHIHVDYDARKSVSPEQLKYYNKLYQYKKDLANRQIQFHIKDQDLIALHHDTSETLHLSITRRHSDHLKDRSKSVSRSKTADAVPRKILYESCPTVLGKDKKIKIGLKSDKKELKKSDEDNITIFVNTIQRVIYYDNHDQLYYIFRIELKDKIYCHGEQDSNVDTTLLARSYYTADTIHYQDLTYDIVYRMPLDFTHPIYIGEYKIAITTKEFVKKLQSLFHALFLKIN